VTVTIAKLMIFALYSYGYFETSMQFNTLAECNAYRAQLQAYPGGRFNGSVSSATFSCVSETVTLPLANPVP
jgi:hypothetical protein